MKYIYETITRGSNHRLETFTRHEELRKVNIDELRVKVYSGTDLKLITVLNTQDDIDSWLIGQERSEVWPLAGHIEWDPFKDTDIQLKHTDISAFTKDNLPYIINQIENAIIKLVAVFKLVNGQTPSKDTIKKWLRNDA